MGRDLLFEYGTLFWDGSFPPSLKSLFPNGKIPPEIPYGDMIVWRRPRQISDNPKFVVGGFSRHDLMQGLLGNCWFLAAVAVLANSEKKLFEKVVPPDQGFEKEKYLGIFNFNFWWYGRWERVYIDDHLPTVDQKLIYANNTKRPNEFWPCLLEKAYAKLRGGYHVLDRGHVREAFVDMTGGIGEEINISQKNNIPPDLYTLLYRSFKMKTLMAVIIAKHDQTELQLPNGLINHHVYSITQFRQVSTERGTVNLLRLRNPWGKGEWTGAWSDKSPEMSQMPERLKTLLFIKDRDEGEFWMAFEDFIANFDTISLCHLEPDAMVEELADNNTKQSWNETVYTGEWIKGVSAGGCGNTPNEDLYWKNPQFYVTLGTPDSILGNGDDCTMIVSLMEMEFEKLQIHIAFEIFQLKTPDLRPLDNSRVPKDALVLKHDYGIYRPDREITRRFELQPGTYVIIPSTFDIDEEARFLLRIFTEKENQSGVLENKVQQAPRMTFNKNLVREAFQRHAGADGRMDAFELQTFLEDISTSEFGHSLKFPIETCRSLITLLDEDKSGFLSFSEVKQGWQEVKKYKEIFKEFDVNGKDYVNTFELGTMFCKLGLAVYRNVLTPIVRRYGGRDNQISFSDFAMVVCKLASLIESFSDQQKKTKSVNSAEFTKNEFMEITMFI